jgi:hypothetical protein
MGSAGRIFRDDFENGYTPWSGTYIDTGATLEISSTRVKKGAYSSKSVCGYGYANAYVYKTFTPIDLVFARAYVYVESLNLLTAYASFINLQDIVGASVVFAGTEQYQNVHYVKISWRDSEGLHTFISSTPYPVGSWHYFTIMQKRDANEGEVRGWFDGVELIHKTSLDTSAYQIGRVAVGGSRNFFSPGGEITVYCDLVEVSDSYIGAYKPLALKANPHAAL